jgi:two-component system capsular synthesis response regulator RcsB
MSKRKHYTAVISPCSMFHSGVQALLEANATSLVWCKQDITEAQQYQNEQPANLLIVSLHVWQTDLLPALRFIQHIRVTQPSVHLMVLLDVAIPYLVTRLRRLGVDHILSLKQPLTEWQTQLHQIVMEENLPLTGGNLPGCREETLSIAERNVLNYLIQGLSVSEISILMMRSTKTISSQKSCAMYKLGIRHCAQLIAVQSVFADSWLPPVRGVHRWGGNLERANLLSEFINSPFENQECAL